MKQFKNLLFLSLILLCWTLVSCKSSKTSSGWSLIWEENFNQKKSFDSQVWSKIPRGKSDWNNYMTDFDSCYAMRKGKLVLRGIVNHTQRNDTAPYLTGGVYTKGKKAFTNGRIEICAKLNAAGGAWPAIWMLPEGAAWPSGGEIDIMEEVGYDPNVILSTVHCKAYNHSIGTQKSGTIKVPTAQTEFHVYAVEWTEDFIKGYVDGKCYFTFDNDKKGNKNTWPFNAAFYLKLNLAWGGDWGGAQGIDESALPATYEIDYVRVFQKK